MAEATAVMLTTAGTTATVGTPVTGGTLEKGPSASVLETEGKQLTERIQAITGLKRHPEQQSTTTALSTSIAKTICNRRAICATEGLSVQQKGYLCNRRAICATEGLSVQQKGYLCNRSETGNIDANNMQECHQQQ